MLKILFTFGLQKIFNVSIERWDTFTNSRKIISTTTRLVILKLKLKFIF